MALAILTNQCFSLDNYQQLKRKSVFCAKKNVPKSIGTFSKHSIGNKNNLYIFSLQVLQPELQLYLFFLLLLRKILCHLREVLPL